MANSIPAAMPAGTPLIPVGKLSQAGKILFVAHLALGDFTYLQSCFQAFARAYPHLEIHLWVDEVRRTSDASKWETLRRYSLYDWVESCPFFAKVYRRTYSPALLRESIAEARGEAYPVVVSLATLRTAQYARLARELAPRGHVVGMRERTGWFPWRRLAYRRLDASIPAYEIDPARPVHISAVYADWFRQLCGLEIAPAQRMPFVDIPAAWRQDALARLAAWGVPSREDAARTDRLVFVNAYAKTRKRSWPLGHVAALIRAMRGRAAWCDSVFVVNATPADLADVRAMLAAEKLERVMAFSAEDNFFQLPALLAQCDLVISVETAVMHLANAVHVPVVALMRTKTPEWVPIDQAHSTVITAARRSDWVDAISVDRVMDALDGSGDPA